MRLVSKGIKESVDNTISYCVFFFSNTTSDTCKRLETLRIKRCNLCCVNVPNFSYPMLIKVVTFTESMRFENVLNVLKLCLNVHRIIFNISSANEQVLDVNFNYNTTWAALSRLSGLELILPSFTRIQGDSVNYCSVFEVIVRSCTYFPRLEYFSICYPMYTGEWTAMFRFLLRNSQTLKSVNIACKSCIDVNAINLRLVNELNNIDSICNLKSFSFTCDVSECGALFAHTWSHILATKQKSINSLRLHSTPMTYLTVRSLFPDACQTLRDLELLINSNDCIKTENTFLERCPNLTQVKLVCVPYVDTPFRFGSNINCNPNRILSLENLSFPRVLVRLALQGCYVETASLVNMTMLDATKNLQELEIYCVGPTFSINYGLTVYCVIRILTKLRDLKVFSFSHATQSSSLRNSDEKVLWTDVFNLASDYGVYHDRSQSGRLLNDMVSRLDEKHSFKFSSQEQRLYFVSDLYHITRNRMM